MNAANVTTKSFEVLDWLNRCTLDIIGKAGFGYEFNSLKDPEVPIRQAYRLVFDFELMSRLLDGLLAFIPASKYIPVKMNRDMETARRIILSKANRIIREKLANAENNVNTKDILALIAKENKKIKAAGERGLSSSTMRDQIMTFLGPATTRRRRAWRGLFICCRCTPRFNPGRGMRSGNTCFFV
jgi:hypothetical protein